MLFVIMLLKYEIFNNKKNGYLKKNGQARFIKKYKFWIRPKKIPSKINKINAAALILHHISYHVIFFFNIICPTILKWFLQFSVL